MKFPSPSEEQAKLIWTAASALAVAILLCLASLIFLGLGWVAKQLSSVLLPLAIAGIIAYLLDPVVDFFQRKGMARTWSILVVFFLAVLLQVGMVGTVVPKLLSDTRDLKAEWPVYKERLKQRINGFLYHNSFDLKPADLIDNIKMPEALSGFLSGFFTEEEPEKSDGEALEGPDAEVVAETEEGAELAEKETGPESATLVESPTPGGEKGDRRLEVDGALIEKAVSVIGPMVSQAGQWLVNSVGQIGSWFGLLAGLALVPVYVFYFLAEKKGIQATWTDYLPIRESKMKEEIVFVLHSINDSLIVFFRSQVLVAMSVGVLLMIGFSTIGLRYGVLLGFIAGILGIVPYLGVMLSIVPAVMISIIQSTGFLHPMLTLGVFGLVQLLEGFVISPKIIGDRVGMHPLTVIISIMIGTTLFGGIVGGVLAIPLTAALRTLMFRYVWKRREWDEFGNPIFDAHAEDAPVEVVDSSEGPKG